MTYKHFIGIDVSKKWLDFTVVEENKILFQTQELNSRSGIQAFIRKLEKEKGYELSTAFFCMEHTGIYNQHLLDYLDKEKAAICLELGSRIKQSSGLQRGKNDKVDSLRIAMYAYKNRDELKLWKPKRSVIQQLKQLITLRRRLVTVAKQLKTPLKEAGIFVHKTILKETTALCKKTLAAVDKDLDSVNEQIKNVIKSDPELNRLFNIITSINGVGAVTASEILITTNEFKDITSAKKFACYCGVAPFEHSSGSSIRGKTRVSHLGNKTVKTLLHLSALAAAVHNPELRIYYERKVKEGKNKMAVLNAVRNKIIHRIFACVNQNRQYENNYQHLLA